MPHWWKQSNRYIFVCFIRYTRLQIIVFDICYKFIPQTNDNQPKYLIFYDFLGWFMLSYTLNTSIIINVVVCAAAVMAITISLYYMLKKSNLSWLPFMTHCLLTLIIQILSLALAAGIPLLIAYFMDIIGCSMSWFSENWLICGLYFCPAFFALGIFPAIFLESTKKVS